VLIKSIFTKKTVIKHNNFQEYEDIFNIIYTDHSSELNKRTDDIINKYKSINNNQTYSVLWTPLIINNPQFLFYKEDIASSAIHITNKNIDDHEENINKDNISNFFKKAQKGIVLVLQIKTIEKSNQCKGLSPLIKEVVAQIKNKINKNDEILITYHFGWCDWILFVNLFPDDQADLTKDDQVDLTSTIFNIKEILLMNNSIKKSKTDILIGCKIENKEKICIPAPNILIRYSTTSDYKNYIKPDNWRCFLKPGIYDLLLSPPEYHITIEDYFNILNNDILKDDHNISDIQSVINLPVIP
jgi:hypothetical protein